MPNKYVYKLCFNLFIVFWVLEKKPDFLHLNWSRNKTRKLHLCWDFVQTGFEKCSDLW